MKGTGRQAAGARSSRAQLSLRLLPRIDPQATAAVAPLGRAEHLIDQALGYDQKIV
jgi:hypothetical protein